MRTVVMFALLGMLALPTLAACGQKGPLYLPDHKRSQPVVPVPPDGAAAPTATGPQSGPAAPAAPTANDPS